MVDAVLSIVAKVFRYIGALLGLPESSNRGRDRQSDNSGITHAFSDTKKPKPALNLESPVVKSSLVDNLRFVRDSLGSSDDLVVREFVLRCDSGETIPAGLIYIDGLVDSGRVNTDILHPLMIEGRMSLGGIMKGARIMESVARGLVTIGAVSISNDVAEIVDAVLSGNSCLFLDGTQSAIILGTRGWPQRYVETPQNEVTAKGPNERFTETLRTNTALLRRRIRSDKLIFETVGIGERAKTDVVMAYISDIASPDLVREVRRRLEGARLDAFLGIGYVEEMITDSTLSFIPLIGNTERPDTFASKLLEGRVGVIADGNPTALTVPMLFVEMFQSPDDYYSSPVYGTAIRWFRYIGFFFASFTPAIYVATVMYHPGIIPTNLMISLLALKEGTPLPTVIEAVAMGLVFEILREAGVRIPRPFGQSLSIVGALVIGQSLVDAGFISAPMVIVVALTAISSFVVTGANELSLFCRLVGTVVAAFLGLPGLVALMIGIMVYILSLKSFGVPILSPVAPLNLRGLKDVLIRAPVRSMTTRPEAIVRNKVRRRGDGA